MSNQPIPQLWQEDMSTGLPGLHELGERYGLQATLRKSDTLYVGFDDISKVRTHCRVRDGWGYRPPRRTDGHIWACRPSPRTGIAMLH